MKDGLKLGSKILTDKIISVDRYLQSYYFYLQEQGQLWNSLRRTCLNCHLLRAGTLRLRSAQSYV